MLGCNWVSAWGGGDTTTLIGVAAHLCLTLGNPNFSESRSAIHHISPNISDPTVKGIILDQSALM